MPTMFVIIKLYIYYLYYNECWPILHTHKTPFAKKKKKTTRQTAEIDVDVL